MNKNILAVCLFLTTSAFADGSILGNPLSLLPVAEKAVEPFMVTEGVLSISSIARSKVTSSGSGECNPFAWNFVLAPKSSSKVPMATATVTVYEEAFTDFSKGINGMKCVPSTHFVIQDEYPMDTEFMDIAKFQSATSLDSTAQIAKANGLATISSMSIRQGFRSDQANVLLYRFYGKDVTGKAKSINIDARTSAILK